MGMVSDMGGAIGGATTDLAKSDIAILLDERCSRYGNGYQTFKLQSLTALQPDTPIVTEQKLNLSNLMNAEPLSFNNTVTKAACVKIQLPREYRRGFSTKFIPPGTRFKVDFLGGDISKPMIVGREDDHSLDTSIGDMNE